METSSGRTSSVRGASDSGTSVSSGEALSEEGSGVCSSVGSSVSVSFGVSVSEKDSGAAVSDSAAFSSSAVQSVVIGRGDVKIKNRAFSYCEDLKNVELKCSSLKIGSYIFYECPNELSISYNGNQYSSESFQELK